MRKLFHRHKSQGSERAIENRPAPTSPEPAATDRKRSEGASPPPLDQASLDLPSRSTFPVTIRSPSSGRKNSSLGLHLVYQPSETPYLDIVFIHGLGGDSRRTWSKDHNPKLFWPGLWLPLEPEFERARIFTFGYNAGFRPGDAKSTANISDFAKGLLFELRFGRTQDGKSFSIGETPIIFVAHSMGGLLAKKACLLGQNDENYKDMVQSISAIIFLSTPHRGSNLAEVLKRILTVSFQSAKHFISDLNKNSFMLEEINEQFRHIAPRLSIWSFYETLPTPVGPRRMMVLEKDSAILGYSKEISRPLYADHHGVCKFSSPEDVNYVSIRNALGSLVEEIVRDGGAFAEQTMDELQTLQGLFSSSIDPEDDLDKHNRLRLEGTCEWVFHEDGMSDWISTSEGCRFVWFNAAPASGKSVLSAYVVTSLQQQGLAPQYFFFDFGDQQKRSVANLLRSIACQIAKENRPFRRGLLDLSKQGLRLDKADASLLWRKAYENLLFKLEDRQPLFWIIDALDECESPKVLLDLIRTCSSSRIPLRIFIASRHTEAIQMGFAKAARSSHLTKLEKQSSSHNVKDIKRLAEHELSHMRGSAQIRDRVIQKIVARAEGNFLWTRLVLEEIVYCHTEAGIQETLDELPTDMHDLYDRMELAILNLPRKSSKLLAKTLLQWTIGARRPMSLQELSQALEPDFPEILDLKRTVSDVCGQFVRVDATDHVAMIHQTAREYLTQPHETELFIDVKANHETLCIRTVTALLDSHITPETADAIGPQSFLLYAATSWSYHLQFSWTTSGKVLDILVKFFNGGAFPLWVYLLSRTSHLDILIKASESLALFNALVRKLNATRDPMHHRLSDLQLLDRWAVDLVKIVGKFGHSLLKSPRAIYGLVSPFAPETSALHQQQYCKNGREVCVAGGLDSAWTDRLARFSMPEGCEAYKLACAGQCIAVLGAKGRVFLWHSQSFVNIHIFEHDEPVTSIAFNAKGDKLVTYGLETTKLWAILSGEILCSVSNVEEARATTLFFTTNDTRILGGFDDRAVRYFDIDKVDDGWQLLNPTLFKETLSAEAAANSPTCVAFSRDSLYAGVAYRGFPLSIWSLESGKCISRCNRGQGGEFSADQYASGWCVVRRFVWNPLTNHIVGLYNDGYVFKWHPLTGEHHEAQAHANDLAASSDGKLFLTSTSTGIIKIWDFAYFSIVYQLSSDDLLMGLAFSPDCQRFYDLRCGTVNAVNAWEPNSLLRFSDTEEVVSDVVSEPAVSISFSQTSEAWLGQFEAVSALAACPNGKCFCFGNDDGAIELRSISGKGVVEVGKFNNFMNVNHLTWSQDSRHFAATDLGGDILIRKIETTDYSRLIETTNIVPLKNPKLDLEEQAIHQVLFNSDSSLLLVVTSQSGHIWSLQDTSIQASAKLADGNLRKWLSHPTHGQLLLGIGSEDVRIFRWQDLSECSKPVSYLHLNDMQQKNVPVSHSNGDAAGAIELLKCTFTRAPTATSEKVRAMVTQDFRHILIRLSSNDSFTGSGRFFICPLSELNPIGAAVNQDNTVAIRSTELPSDVRSQVRIALGVLPDNRFVFLDWELWICTYNLDASTGQTASKMISPKSSTYLSEDREDLVLRHYFVPDDWAMGDGLDLCCMTADGTLLYPRDDKVSVIKADVRRPAFWWGSSPFGI